MRRIVVRLSLVLAGMAACTVLISLARPAPSLATRVMGPALLERTLSSLAAQGVTAGEGERLSFDVPDDGSCERELARTAGLQEALRPADGRADVVLGCEVRAGHLVVSARAGDRAATVSERIPDFRSVLPPILAVLLALGLRNVHVALLAAIWTGGLLAFGVDWTLGARTLLVRYLWGTLVDQFNFSILVFTLALVGMVQVANRAGGGQGLADAVGRLAKSARSSKLAVSVLGLLIFFDDYSNTVVVGTTIRSLTDRFRVSREKLAYLVDSTSAPVAGIALISTWIGYEVGLFQELSDSLGLGITGYAIFLKVLPLRFYCFGALALVLLTSATNRDFGPMLRAERRARSTGELIAPGARPMVSKAFQRIRPVEGVRPWWVTVVVPVVVSLAVVVVGMVLDGGRAGSEAARWAARRSAFDPTYLRLAFEGADAAFVLLVASLAGSWTAVLMAVLRPFSGPARKARRTPLWQAALPLPAGLATALVIAAIHETFTLQTAGGETVRAPSPGWLAELVARPDTQVLLWVFGALSLAVAAALACRAAVEGRSRRRWAMSFTDASRAWTEGLRSMAYAISILVMAWAIRRVCDDLGTSTFIVSTLGSVARPWLIPTLTFVLSSLVAFSTGTSWGAMGILIPTLMPFAFHMGGMPTLLLSMGAVLDGSIFGDHCSPISDTTVLSSIATGCDHIDHVKTQIPYALTAFGAALAAGYLPLGLGVPLPLEHVAGAVVLLVAVRIIGRKVAG